MNGLPLIRPKTVLRQRRKIVNEDGSPIKTYYDGRKWRRLCSVYECEKIVHSEGFCARHHKQATSGELTFNHEPQYDLIFSDQSDSILETIEDSEQNILSSYQEIIIPPSSEQNITPNSTEEISVYSTNDMSSTNQMTGCASTITMMPATECNKNIFRTEEISSGGISDTSSNAMIADVRKEDSMMRSNRCQYQLPGNNGPHCRCPATYKCSHCSLSSCLQHGLQHQDDLKDEIRSLLSKAQGLFNNVQRMNIVDGKTSCSMLLNQWAATMHAKIDQARHELQIKLDECDKKIEEKKDQWRIYLGNHLEQNVGCILTEQLQKYEIDALQTDKARAEFIRLQKLFHSLNNQQLINMIEDEEYQMSLNLPIIVCSNIVFEGLDSMNIFYENINPSDQQINVLHDNSTCSDETSHNPNVVATPTQPEMMIGNVNDRRANLTRESTVAVVQDIPPMLPFTRIATQVNNSTNPIVTRTEADIIRTDDNKNTQRAQETNISITQNIPSTTASKFTTNQRGNNPNFVVTSTESGMTRNVNDARTTTAKRPNTDNTQNIPSTMASNLTPSQSRNNPNFVVISTESGMISDFNETRTTTPKRSNIDNTQNIPSTMASNLTPSQSRNNPNFVAISTESGMISDFNDTRTTTPKRPNIDNTQNIPSTMASNFTASQSGKNPNFVVISTESGMISDFDDTRTTTPKRPNIDNTQNIPSTMASNFTASQSGKNPNFVVTSTESTMIRYVNDTRATVPKNPNVDTTQNKPSTMIFNFTDNQFENNSNVADTSTECYMISDFDDLMATIPEELNMDTTQNIPSIMASNFTTSQKGNNPNVAVTSTENGTNRNANDTRATTPKKPNIDNTQNKPSTMASNVTTSQSGNNPNFVVTSTESGMIRNVNDTRTTTPKKPNIDNTQNIPSTMASNFTASQSEKNPNFVVTSKESGMIDNFNDTRTTISKKPNVDTTQNKPSTMIFNFTNNQIENNPNITAASTESYMISDFDDLMPTTPEELNMDTTQNIPSTTASNFTTSQRGNNPNVAVTSTENGTNRNANDTRATTPKKPNVDTTQNIPSTMASNFTASQSGNNPNFVATSKESGMINNFNDTKATPPKNPNVDTTQNNQSTMAFNFTNGQIQNNPNIAVPSTESYMISDFDDLMATIPEELNMDIIQEIQSAWASNFTTSQKGNNPNVAVTSTENGTIKNGNTRWATTTPKELNIDNTQNTPATRAFSFRANQIENNRNVAVTSTESYMISNFNDKGKKNPKDSDSDSMHNISSMMSDFPDNIFDDSMFDFDFPTIVLEEGIMSDANKTQEKTTSNNREAISTRSSISKPNSKIRQNSNNKQASSDLERTTLKPSNPKPAYKTRQNSNNKQASSDLEPTTSKPSNPKPTYKTRQNANDRQDSLDLEPTTSRSSIPKLLKPGKTSNDKQDDFKLDLSSHELSDEDMAFVVRDALKNNQLTQPFRILDLSGNQIGADGIDELSSALMHNTTLTTLILHTNEIDNVGAEYISKALEKNSTLTDLDISENQIGPLGIRYISTGLEKNTGLTVLNLDHNQVGSKGAQTLGVALLENKTLKVLKLNWCNIENSGARFLCDSLYVNTSLHTLELASNRIDETGALNFRSALKNNKGLKVLNLRCNSLGETGTFYICDALRSNTTLEELNLERNTIRDMGVNHLCTVLRDNSTLTTLNISGNVIGKLGADFIGEMLHVNKSLTNLNVSYNGIRSPGGRAIGNALINNTTLLVLNLEHNHIAETGIRALTEAMEKNRTLTKLDIDGNNVSVQEKMFLEDQMKRRKRPNENGDRH